MKEYMGERLLTNKRICTRGVKPKIIATLKTRRIYVEFPF